MVVVSGAPDISNSMVERFARRVYVPVTMACVAVLSLVTTSVAMRLILSLMFTHVVLPHWAIVIPSLLGAGGVWGVLILPFLYVVFWGYYGFAQKREIEHLGHPISTITAAAKLIYGVIHRIVVYALTGMDSTLSPVIGRGAHQIQSRQVATQRESHMPAPRLRVGRAATSKEAGHARLSTHTSTSTVAIAPTGGAGA
jgi:hypothetical protein